MPDENKPARTRQRATRPDGSFYSSDPKIRHQQLVDDGKIGGPGSDLAKQHGKKGGRPRKPRAAEMVAEKARSEAEKIWAAFDDALDEEQPIRVRMEAANAVINIERNEASLQLDEEKYDNMSDEELNDKLYKLMNSPMVLAALESAEVDE